MMAITTSNSTESKCSSAFHGGPPQKKMKKMTCQLIIANSESHVRPEHATATSDKRRCLPVFLTTVHGDVEKPQGKVGQQGTPDLG